MAIKYLDAKRIRGSSTAALSSQLTWNAVQGSANQFQVAHKDFGSTISDTVWRLRFKLVISNYNQGNSGDNIFMFMGMADDTNNAHDDKDAIGLYLRLYSGGSQFFNAAHNQNYLHGGSHSGIGSTSAMVAGTYYVEIKRTAADSVTTTIFTDANYSSTWATANTHSISGITSLRYFTCHVGEHDNVSNHTLDGYITDITFCDGDLTTVDYATDFSTTVSSANTASDNSGWTQPSKVTITNTTQDEKATLIDTSTYGTASWTGTGSAGSGTSSHDNYIRLPTNPVQAVTTSGSGTAFTIAFWVKSNSGFDTDAFMGTYDGESSAGSHFQLYTHGVDGLKLSDGSLHANWTTIPESTIENNSWHHIALTRPASSSTVSAYLDGVLKTAADGDYAGRLTSNTSNSTWLKIGGRGDNNDNYPTMSMQDLGFWTREMSAADIAVLATGKPIDKATLSTAYTTNLTGYYKFDGDYTDSSSNTNTGIAGSDVSLATSGGKFDSYVESNLPENTLFEETDTYKTYWLQDNEWLGGGGFSEQTTPIWGTKAYWWLGGGSGVTGRIQESAMPVTTNATIKADTHINTGGENTNFPTFTKLYSLGGNTINNIGEYTMGTTTAATDKADLRYAVGRCRAKAYDGTYGYQMGGFSNSASTAYSEIQSYTIGTTTTAIDKADLNRVTCNQAGGVYGKTYAYSIAGFSGSSNFVDIQEYAMGTTTTASDKADDISKRDISSISNTTDLWTSDGTSNGVTQYTMNTGTNSTNHGNMSTHLQSPASANSTTYGYWASEVGILEYQMGTSSTVVDKGDMTTHSAGSCPASGQGSP